MANQYYFRDSSGSTRIPIANGEFFTGEMSGDYLRGNCFLRFLDADGNNVTPSSGTIVFDSSPIDGQFLMAPTVQSVNANEVNDVNATYTPPTFDSIAIDTRMTLQNITGPATHVEAFHWRY